jgi:hypothetical protein
MNDVAGLTYDDDAAAHFAATSTGLDAKVCAAVLRSKDRYLFGLGILPADWFEAVDKVTRSSLRAAHPSLFPAAHVAKRFVDQPLQRAFIVRDCGVNEETVRVLLAADDEYMRRRGIID